MLEARKALAGTIDFEREIGAGDRFYVRYRQPFTVDGTPIGTAQLIWLELRTTAKGTVGLHRFRPNGGAERLWLANGEAAGSTALRLPLDVINVSSGFGLRADPLDKPGPPMGPLADPAPVAAAPPPEPPPLPRRSRCRRRAGRRWAAFPPSAARAMSSTPAVPISIAVAPSLSRHPRRPRRPNRQRPRRPRLPRRPSRACSCMTASISSR